MKLKYYLRGMGIGILLSAIVMGFALGGRKATLSDAEIIRRAKELGMVEAGSGVLSQAAGEVKTDENDSSTSGSTLDKEGSQVSEENQQEVADTDQSVSEVAKAQEKGETTSSEAVSYNSEASTAVTKEEVKEATKEVSAAVEDTKKEESSSESASSTAEALVEESAPAESSKEVEEPEAPAPTGSVSSVTKVVTIPGGMGSDQVAQILYREGVIDNAVTFNRYLIDRGQDRIIRSGTKTIPAGSTYEQIASIITKG